MTVQDQMSDLREKVLNILLDQSGLDEVSLKATLEKLVELDDPWGKHHLAASYERGLIGEVDQIKANSLYLSAAKDGYSDSQMAIGNNLLHGIGIEKNVDEAIDWLGRAAEDDNGYANFLLATIYLHPDSQKQDIKLGLDFLERAVDLGDLRAQTRMAAMLFTGNLVQKNIPQSIALYTKAADEGFDIAAYDLAKIYEDGVEITQDYEKCVRYLNIAADQNHMMAIHDLGTMYFNGFGVDKDEEKAKSLYIKAMNFGSNLSSYCLGLMEEQDNPRWALLWFLISEAQGNSDAAPKIQELSGDLTEERKSSLEHVLKDMAEDKNFVWAQLAIADLYMTGYLLDKDLDKAAHFFQLAADNNNDKAQSRLGYMYINGLGVERDYEKAAELFTKAAASNNPDATNDLANMYRYGLFFKKDMNKAKELFERAAELNSPNAMYTMSLFYSDGTFTQGVNQKKAMEYLNAAVKLNFPPAIRELATKYEHGDGFDKDINKSLEMNQEAAYLGDTIAKFNLGCLYQYEFKDIEKAAASYEAAANENYPSAQYNLAKMYIDGLIGEPDYNKAEYWLKLAIENEHSGAMGTLAILYYEGHPKKDLKTALTLLEQSASMGNDYAQYNMGIFCRDGIGMSPDYEKAINWFNRCAMQGNPEAQAEIALCLISDKNPTVDYIEAMKWALLAQKNHEPRADKIIEFLEDEMSEADIAEAQIRVKGLVH